MKLRFYLFFYVNVELRLSPQGKEEEHRVTVLENRKLRRLCENKREEITSE
jgi:hypothetical protein